MLKSRNIPYLTLPLTFIDLPTERPPRSVWVQYELFTTFINTVKHAFVRHSFVANQNRPLEFGCK